MKAAGDVCGSYVFYDLGIETERVRAEALAEIAVEIDFHDCPPIDQYFRLVLRTSVMNIWPGA